MADRGITFSAAMVRALLDGRKTQTRRLIAAQPPEHVTSAGSYSNSIEGPTRRWSWLSGDPRDCDTWGFEGDFKVPHAIGDRLYVREHWSTHSAFDGIAPRDLKRGSMFYTRADGLWHNHGDWIDAPFGKHRQAMHMPRWASRLTLLVTDVRVQRLQEISEEDAAAEGMHVASVYGPGAVDAGKPASWRPFAEWDGPLASNARVAFIHIWNSLHTEPGTRWEDSPWIYALSFDVRRGNIDQIGGEA